MRNVDLLEKVAERIEAEPDRWIQEAFVTPGTRTNYDTALICDSAFCIAGWAVAIDLLEQGERTISVIGLMDEGLRLLGLELMEAAFMFHRGFFPKGPAPHKEVAEWLRGIARGDDVVETAPEWWDFSHLG